MTGEALLSNRWGSLAHAALVSTTVLVAVAGTAAYAYLAAMALAGDSLGIDLRFVLVLGQRWIDTGTMYLPYQLSGPYPVNPPSVDQVPGLYPPAAGPVFAALTLVPFPLLAVAWFAVPVAIVIATLREWRPAVVSWPILIALTAWPTSAVIIVCGGTTMWAAVLVALALRGVRGPVALLLLKPTLLPFAIIGVRSRSFWLTAAAIAVVTLLGPWRDYVTVVQNAEGLDYAAWSVPIMLAPFVAWVAKRTAPRGKADRAHTPSGGVGLTSALPGW